MDLLLPKGQEWIDIKQNYPYYFIFPALIIFLLLSIAPNVAGILYSFTDWNVMKSEINFIGLDNFRQLLGEDGLGRAIKNTFTFAIGTTLAQNVLGLLLAVILSGPLKTKVYLRTVFFIPAIFSSLLIGYMFNQILGMYGILNKFLSFIGLDSAALDWLGLPKLAIYVVTSVNTWQFTGYTMIIYLAAIQAIDRSIYESGRIDGAGRWQSLIYITLPLVVPAFTINILLSLVNSLKVFDIVYILTGGGPGRSSEVMNTFIFGAFSRGEYGYGTAGSLVLTILISIIGFTTLYYLRKREVEL